MNKNTINIEWNKALAPYLKYFFQNIKNFMNHANPHAFLQSFFYLNLERTITLTVKFQRLEEIHISKGTRIELKTVLNKFPKWLLRILNTYTLKDC